MPLTTDPPHPDPGWRALLASGEVCGRRLIYYAETASTNDIAMQLGLAGETCLIVLADRQSKGRGRLGRTWQSPPGCGLYLSMLLQPELEPRELPKVTLAAGLGVCLAIEEICRLSPQIKWPNDLLLNGRKVAGILTETGPWQTDQPPLVVVGIGINVNTGPAALPEELRQRASSLAIEAGRPFHRSALFNGVVDQVDTAVARLCQGEFTALLAQIRCRDATLGRELTWLTSSGQQVHGISLGIDEAGLLHIRDAGGTIHQVLSGDLTLAAR